MRKKDETSLTNKNCRQCGGSGKLYNGICPLCKGDGKVKYCFCLDCRRKKVMQDRFDKICSNCKNKNDFYREPYRIVF